MDKIYEQTMLFDFYGELLTEHQRRVYEAAIYHDMSLAEIAQEQGISRQGVHDLIKRCDKILAGYEDKLHLVERFAKAKRMVQTIQGLAREAEGILEEETPVSCVRQIQVLSGELLEEL